VVAETGAGESGEHVGHVTDGATHNPRAFVTALRFAW
jgi:hypothetical protein